MFASKACLLLNLGHYSFHSAMHLSFTELTTIECNSIKDNDIFL